MKSRLQELLQMDRELTENEHREINPCGARSIEAALHVIGHPVQCCVKVYELVCKLVEIVRSKRDDPKTKSMSGWIFKLKPHFIPFSFIYFQMQMACCITAKHGN